MDSSEDITAAFADTEYSAQAVDLAGRMAAFLRREYADGCRNRFNMDAALLSFIRRAQDLPRSEEMALRRMVKALEGYGRLGLGKRQYCLVQTGQQLARAARGGGSSAAPAEDAPPQAQAAPESRSYAPPRKNGAVTPPAPHAAAAQTEAVPRLSLRTAPSGAGTSSGPVAGPVLYKLDTPVERIRGVGITKRAVFQKQGLYTIQDLLLSFPVRWEDRTKFTPAADLRPGAYELMALTVMSVQVQRRAAKKVLIEASCYDESGSVKLVWFNQPYIAKSLRPQMQIYVYGKAEYDTGFSIKISAPEFTDRFSFSPSFGRIVPIYKLSTGLYQSFMHKLMFRLVPTYAKLLPETLPEPLLKKYGLMSKAQAVTKLHWPGSFEEMGNAQRRLAFEELFRIQIHTAKRRSGLRSRRRSVKYGDLDAIAAEFRSLIPFKLTGAQERTIKEICENLRQDYPMNRMLQGDVGSGKTIIAAFAAFAAVRSGYQAAIMAPTEILAQQHFNKLAGLLEPAGIRVTHLRGSMTKKTKMRIAASIAAGEADLAVGTHALIQDTVEFLNLGMAVVDEQHKFGVLQRQALKHKSGNETICDALLMTATPIPRTMSLTIYGDLDLSRLDELPPGRMPIKSSCVAFRDLDKVYRFIIDQIHEGRQAYIVCPLIEESANMEASAAVAEAERLQNTVFRGLRVSLLHGRMKAAQKEEIMEAFRSRESDILISTTVIEVGVDVPNASIILVQDANHFGMAQLHQLRGRIGRGTYQSYCFFAASADANSLRKLEAVARLSDGFEVAEEDLDIRGPGDYFGTRQSGFPELQCADLVRDYDLLEAAKQEAPLYADSYPDELLGDDGQDKFF